MGLHAFGLNIGLTPDANGDTPGPVKWLPRFFLDSDVETRTTIEQMGFLIEEVDDIIYNVEERPGWFVVRSGHHLFIHDETDRLRIECVASMHGFGIKTVWNEEQPFEGSPG